MMTEGTRVRLDGDAMDVAALAELFEHEVSICKDAQGTHHLKVDAAPQEFHEVMERAERLLERLNGIARIQYTNHRSVKAGTICLVNATGATTNQVILGRVSIVCRSRVSAGGIVISGDSDEVAVPPRRGDQLLAITRSNPHFAAALHLYGQPGLNWGELYNVLDAIEEGNGGGHKLPQKGWASRAEIGNFTATANSYPTIGIKARHGKVTKAARPQNELTLEEARNLIERLMNRWAEELQARNQ